MLTALRASLTALMMAGAAGCVSDGASSSAAPTSPAALSSDTSSSAAASSMAGASLMSSASTPAPAGAESCSGCHPASSGVASPVPRLVGQSRQAIIDAMSAFRSGQRPATVMDRIAKGYDDAEVQAIATWFASRR